MKNYLLILCAFLLLEPMSGFSQKYYEFKFNYDGLSYDGLEMTTKKESTVRTNFMSDSENYVITADYKNYYGKMDNGDNYCLMVTKGSPNYVSQNRKQINLGACYFYKVWGKDQSPSMAKMYWNIDRHPIRDPKTEKYMFNGKPVTYRKILKAEDVTDKLQKKYMIGIYEPIKPDPIVADNGNNEEAYEMPVATKPRKIEKPAQAAAKPVEEDTQEDLALIQEARYALALDKKDCIAALNSLKKVSKNGQKHRLFIYYASLAYDCNNDYEMALSYYKKYLNFSPNNTEVINKIAELSYKLHNNSPVGNWVDVKATNGGKNFFVTTSGTKMIIKSTDSKINFILDYSKPTTDGGKRYDGYLKIPLQRNFPEGKCNICGYNDGLSAYCEVNSGNSNIRVYVRDLNIALEPEKKSGGRTTYKPCCKVVPMRSFDFVYELERN